MVVLGGGAVSYGLVREDHIFLHHSTLGSGATKKRRSLATGVGGVEAEFVGGMAEEVRAC